MIFVRDKGRMCNNILQYGHVYAWAREHGRETMSMRFAYKYRYFHICHTPHHNFPTYVAAKYLAKWKLIPTVGFHSLSEDNTERERMMMERKWIVVEGWCVRYYDLFLKYKSEIVKLFAFDRDVIAATDRYFTNDGAISLGVHIRRGDYRTWHGGKYFYPDEVYIDYIRQFANLHSDRRIDVYICGNDPSLDHSKYVEQLGGMRVSFPQGNPGEDLCLLSRCDYLIGAPSTFTLVASMYRDIPLCWMEEASVKLGEEHFGKFDTLFRNIR